jgi:hypothetical protein
MPSTRLLARAPVALAGVLLTVLALSGVAVAQTPTGGRGLGLGTRIGIRFVVALVFNLLLASALVGLGPRYATETVTAIREDPVVAFGWGLIVGVGVPILLALLAITIVGLVVAIPGFLLLAVVGIVGNAVAIVWVGTLFGDGRVGGKAAGVGALAVAIPASIPVLGNLVTSVVGLFGIGVVGQSLYAVWKG